VTVIATGFGAQRRRRARASASGSGEQAPLSRTPEFDTGDALDVPSFLRDD
jgi:hypothetical protein